MEKRKNFSTQIGMMLAAAGSAVGLGNVWRFPTETGNNGGAAFILIYLLCVVLIGAPVMISEFVVGRHTHSNTIAAFSRLAPGKWWRMEGVSSVFVAFILLSYYIVVSGWTLFYLVQSLCGNLIENQNYTTYFEGFVSSSLLPVIAAIAFMFITHIVIVMGVESGIERFSKAMMPTLFVILLVLVGCAFFMPGMKSGLKFLLYPDFHKITPRVVLSAMGQAFYSLSLAMGCLCTYASYFGKEAKIVRTAYSVCAIDSMVAILSGFFIFPAVFSVSNVNVDQGPGLVFCTLPNVFNIAFADFPVVGYLFSALFYLLLLLAALTSAISLHEPVTAFFIESTRMRRKQAATLVSVACSLLGIACSLSFGLWKDYKIFGLTIFDFLDFGASKIIMPLGGMIFCLFVGWYLPKKLVRDELTNEGTVTFRLFPVYLFLVRYVVPAAIGLILINELFG